MARPFTLLIKPASADCNLNCEYCFYLGHVSFYPGTSRHRMPESVLDQTIRTYMHTEQPSYQFGWQGGEPTLMGADFFRQVVNLQTRHGRPGATVANGLQTNGTLITDEMASLFAEYRFLLGVSVDGPAAIHDHYRRRATGAGSHADVMRGVACLRRAGTEYNTLTLVSQANVAHTGAVYDFLCESGSLHHQYIPCVESDAERRVLPFSISGAEWGEFLCRLFDRWYPHDVRRVSIRDFDAVLSLLVDGVRNVCPMGRDCCQYFVVEYGGDVYPCDFFVEKQLRLGNVMTDAWAAMQASPIYRDFGARKQQWNRQCGECRYIDLCAGDCLKHRLCAGGGDPLKLSLLCDGIRRFYDHTLARFRELAAAIVAERRRTELLAKGASRSSGRQVGRNDPCPCGSGRKLKRCCGGGGTQ